MCRGSFYANRTASKWESPSTLVKLLIAPGDDAMKERNKERT